MKQTKKTIVVEEDVHLKLRILTAVLKKTSNEIINDMINEYVKGHNIKVTGIF